MNKLYVTYEYWNPLTNQVFYVGAGNKRRIHFHLYEAKRVAMGFKIPHPNRYKLNIILSIWSQNYDPIIKIIYEGSDRNTAFENEISAIKKYGRRDNGTGILTNLTDGGYVGNHGMRMSDSNREKMSKRVSGKNNPNYGKKIPQHIKEYMSTLMKDKMMGDGNPFFGKRHSDETKQSISTTRKNMFENGTLTPHRHSTEHKQKLSKLYEGTHNPSAQYYDITNPDGYTIRILGLSSWCKEHDFSYHVFTNLLRSGIVATKGKAKGWSINKSVL